MVEVITRANPHALDELQRDFRPLQLHELDATGLDCLSMGLPAGLEGSYRVMVVIAVDRTDANKLRRLAKILGPATGGPMLSIPCGEANEWAYIQDLMESRMETLSARRIARALRLAEWNKSMNKQLVDVADNMEKQKRGHSSFGYGGKLQRST